MQARVVVQTRRDAGPSVAVRLAIAGLVHVNARSQKPASKPSPCKHVGKMVA